MFMTTKTITIMEDAYNVLAKEKLPDESFSDTIRRVVGKKTDILDFFGVWDEETAVAVEKAIAERRSNNVDRSKRRDDLFSA